jgi:hypothetical protein
VRQQRHRADARPPWRMGRASCGAPRRGNRGGWVGSQTLRRCVVNDPLTFLVRERTRVGRGGARPEGGEGRAPGAITAPGPSSRGSDKTVRPGVVNDPLEFLVGERPPGAPPVERLSIHRRDEARPRAIEGGVVPAPTGGEVGKRRLRRCAGDRSVKVPRPSAAIRRTSRRTSAPDREVPRRVRTDHPLTPGW